MKYENEEKLAWWDLETRLLSLLIYNFTLTSTNYKGRQINDENEIESGKSFCSTAALFFNHHLSHCFISFSNVIILIKSSLWKLQNWHVAHSFFLLFITINEKQFNIYGNYSLFLSFCFSSLFYPSAFLYQMTFCFHW